MTSPSPAPAPEKETEYVVVPREPTREQRNAGAFEVQQCIHDVNDGKPDMDHETEAVCVYDKMLAARPDSGHVPVPRDLAEYALGSMESEDLIGTGSYSRRERARIQREHDKQTERFRALLAATKQKGEGR